MSDEASFFIYLLEHYAHYRGVDAAQVLREWDELDVTQLIYDMGYQYHQESLENAYADIDSIVMEKRKRLS